MDNIDVQGRAAFRQTWRAKPVRELLAQIIAENKDADEKTLRREFRAAVRDDDDYFLAVADYAFDAAYRALTLQKGRPSAALRATRAADAAERAAAHARTVKGIQEQILLLNMEMPNGKRMRYCTGAEMTSFGRGYERIGKRVGKAKLVGEALNEAEIRKIMST
jgi:hypothetical protein